MRVAFNATPLLAPVTGIGNYTVHLGRALADRGVDAYSFYRYRWRHEAPASRPASDPHADAFHGERRWLPFRGTARRVARHFGFRQGLRRYGVELYHEPNYVPLSYDVPVVVTIHDLSWIRFPQAHPLDRVRWLERGVPEALDRAREVLVDSDFIRDEVLTIFGVDCERVHTAHLGAPPDCAPRDARATSTSLAPLRLVHGEYVLTVGTIEPRKNLNHILAAHALLPAALRARFPLVIAGARGWQSADVLVRLRSPDEHVRFVGHVRRAVLRDLYAGAALFAFPSLYEGFGLPPLEAMASGTPVLVSDRASLPEVVGDAGATLDPENPERTASALQALLEDDAARRVLGARGLARAARFTWAGCAATTEGVYRSALSR